MLRCSHNNVATDYIPNAWLEDLRKDNLAGIALRGPGKNLTRNVLQYSRQLVVLGSMRKILVNLN
ncbi:MAG: hypothetical protein FWF09_00900 [Bacteroidales bacterium]|nr:hypothetical protein [Bacteroidales bacterium]